MTLAEMWRQEGREEGLEKGIELGQAKAMSKMAIVQLTNKFGLLPEHLKETISKADVPTLELILTNIFTIENIDDVKRYFN